MGDKYREGVPELGLPSLDPMSMPKIEIQMGNNKVKMEDITSTGFCPKNELFKNELKPIARNEQYQRYLRELRQEHETDDDEDDLQGHGDEWKVHSGSIGQVQRAVQEQIEEHDCQERCRTCQEGGRCGG